MSRTTTAIWVIFMGVGGVTICLPFPLAMFFLLSWRRISADWTGRDSAHWRRALAAAVPRHRRWRVADGHGATPDWPDRSTSTPSIGMPRVWPPSSTIVCPVMYRAPAAQPESRDGPTG